MIERLNLFKKSNPNPEKENRILESQIITARKWPEYSSDLKISSELLEGKKILNLGSGYSHLKEDLKKMNIHPQQIVELDKAFLKLKERNNFIQAEATQLPFSDRTFDIVLAFWSTYQIPPDNKKRAYQEIFRIAKYSHIAPIYKEDFEIIQKLISKNNQLKIVLCQPFGNQDITPVKQITDYNDYLNNLTSSERIKKPLLNKPQIIEKDNKKFITSEGSSLIIVKSF